MTLSLIIGLAAWSLVSTFFLLRSIRSSDNRRQFNRRLQRSLKRVPPDKEFEAVLSAHEATEKSLPWFQRSLSTLGVVAFFSMSAAALTQTISAQLSEFKASAAERRYSYVQDTARIAEIANARSSRAILAMSASGIPQMPEVTEFLESRLEMLTDPRRAVETTDQHVHESIAIAIGLKRTNCAAQIWTSHPDINLESLNLRPFDLLAFSKLFHFLGEDARASTVMATLPASSWIAFEEDVAAVRYALSKRDGAVLDRLVQDISETFRVPKRDVQRNVMNRVRSLNDDRSALVSRHVDFCRPGNPASKKEGT